MPNVSRLVRIGAGSARIGLMPVVALVLLGFCVQPALAYADPGTGTLIWQTVVAVFVGAMFNVRRLVEWLKSRRHGAGK